MCVRHTHRSPFQSPENSQKTQAEWIGETGEAQEQDVEFDEIKQRPYNLVGWTTFSKELLMSSSVEVEDLVSQRSSEWHSPSERRKPCSKPLGLTSPTGLEANTDIRTISRSSANSVTENELLEAEESVLTSNVVIQSPNGKNLESGESNTNMRLKKAELTWIVSPKFRRLCKSVASLDGGSGNLWSTGNTGSDAVTIHRDGSTRQPRDN